MTETESYPLPVVGIVGSSGSGKTTLLVGLIALLRAQGLRIGVLKQARADFDVDTPGKDSFELRKAGVDRLVLASETKAAMIVERRPVAEPTLSEALAEFDSNTLDLILVEGFAAADYPKIEVWRPVTGSEPRYRYDPAVIAVATDAESDCPVPVLDLNDSQTVADFIVTRFLPKRAL